MKRKLFISTLLLLATTCLRAVTLNYWTTAGRMLTVMTRGDSVVVPATAAAIDLRNAPVPLRIVTREASSNCLYYVLGIDGFSGLPEQNVVCGGICDVLLITDAAPFYCPVAFTATAALFSMTPRRDDPAIAADAVPWHETLFLPFDADDALPSTVNGFMPEGWLTTAIFTDRDRQTLTFLQTPTPQLKAYTPCLLTVNADMQGAQLLFTAADKAVPVTRLSYTYIKNVMFRGTTAGAQGNSRRYAYVRTREPYFTLSTSADTLEPFRCFLQRAGTDEGDPSRPSDDIAGDLSRFDYVTVSADGSAIVAPKVDADEPDMTGTDGHVLAGVYTLGGVRLPKGYSSSGIYIVGDKCHLSRR